MEFEDQKYDIQGKINNNFDFEGDFGLNKKCGEIFIQTNQQFYIVCCFCIVRFAELEQFTTHYSDKHFNESINSICLNGKDQGKVDFIKIEPNIPTEMNESDENIERTKSNDPLSEIETSFVVFKNEILLENNEFSDSNANRTKMIITSRNKKAATVVKRNRKRKIVSRNYSCSLCGKEYTSEELVKDHEKYDHLQSDLFLNLNKTGSDADGDESEKDEENKTRSIQVKSTVIDTKKCRFCCRKFRSRFCRIDHERFHHLSEKLFNCKYCNKQFPSERRLKQHERYHSNDKPYKCNICDATFAMSGNLSTHLRRHKGEKNVACSYCDRKFFDNSAKIIHERTHTGERPFQCINCGKCFITSSALFYHRKLHHSSVVEKPHKCEVCSKCFTTATMLKNHSATHSNLRPFKCEFCDKSFKLRKGLNAHSKIHSDTINYTCNVCGKGFKQYSGLYCHRKAHGIQLDRDSSEND